MPDQPTDPALVLAACARLLARGGTLEARLDGLAEQARLLSGASSAVLYLLDGDQGLLLPAGAAGIGDGSGGRDGLDVLAVGEGAPADAVGRAVRARRSDLVPVGPEMTVGLPAGARYVAVIAHVPLVTEDEQGAQEVEGLLAAGFATAPAEGEVALARLNSIADLAAFAIRQARHEQALLERSDWFDRMANTDPLTGIANRRTFERILELELARAGRQGTQVSLAVFDVDGLARIDRSRGADVADDVLRTVASALADSVRLVDTVARYGGDEFALLAPGTAGVTVAQRVLTSAGKALAEGGTGAALSVGVARFPDDGATAAELLDAADAAMHVAKAQGGGRIAEAGAAGRA
ncbi:MAG: diguanylate cyclase domain-containing protein [Candidatus Limnocylindrales bacterium]